MQKYNSKPPTSYASLLQLWPSDWWLSLPHLKNMSPSIGMMKFPIYGKHIKCSKPPTSHLLVIYSCIWLFHWAYSIHSMNGIISTVLITVLSGHHSVGFTQGNPENFIWTQFFDVWLVQISWSPAGQTS